MTGWLVKSEGKTMRGLEQMHLDRYELDSVDNLALCLGKCIRLLLQKARVCSGHHGRLHAIRTLDDILLRKGLEVSLPPRTCVPSLAGCECGCIPARSWLRLWDTVVGIQERTNVG